MTIKLLSIGDHLSKGLSMNIPHAHAVDRGVGVVGEGDNTE